LVIIGAGPAGLTAGLEATKHGLKPVVVERRDKVGGIACTEDYKGFLFDMGGHRFFSKVREVLTIWNEILGDNFLVRPRLSRIYYQGKFFDYPLKPMDTVMNLGLAHGTSLVLSYFKWQLFPYREEDNFEQWVTNRFGRGLFETFFKSYTEKVWGVPCTELRAEWAAQRIKDLSLKKALVSMFLNRDGGTRTLIDQFQYPAEGPGMMWNAVRKAIEAAEGSVRLNQEVVSLVREGDRISRVVASGNNGSDSLEGDQFISSMPITGLVKRFEPAPPEEVLEAAGRLKYRDFLVVCLVVAKTDLFPDQWIYIHDPKVKMGRIQNFVNWSPRMVPDPGMTGLGLEYFCNQGDELWTQSDQDLIELGKEELAKIGLAGREDVVDGVVYRVPKAYPVYDSEFKANLETLREYISPIENLQTIGRNGLFRYNNMDHSMLTGLAAVSNIVQEERMDPWAINEDEEFLEEGRFEEVRRQEELERALEEKLAPIFEKVDRVALGLALGAFSGLGLSLMTLFLVLKGGKVVGPTLALLGQYLPGYTVSLAGSLLGLIYGFILGFLLGWCGALIRNFMLFLNLRLIHRRALRGQSSRLWDYF
jgi:protoporphyrinogen oxidase